MNKGYCICCGKIILPGQDVIFSKPKRGRIMWAHTECVKKNQQKCEDSPKEIERTQTK